MLDAIASSRERKTHLVSWLVSHDMASARDIAIAAATEFGMPLLDLDAVAIDIDTVRLVSDKLLAEAPHPAARPARQAAARRRRRSDQSCTPSTRSSSRPASRIEAVVVEDDKLQRAVQTGDRAGRHRRCRSSAATTTTSTSRTSTSSRGDDDVDGVGCLRATTSKTRRSCASSTRSCSMRSAAARRTSTSSLTRSTYRIRLRIDGVLQRNRAAAGAARDEARGAPQGHVAARHRRAARAAGRPHQDAAVEELARSTSA